jgi:hypothetical protein
VSRAAVQNHPLAAGFSPEFVFVVTRSSLFLLMLTQRLDKKEFVVVFFCFAVADRR